MPWKKLLAWATGQVDEALCQELEFGLEENRVYRALLERHSPRWRLHEAERKVLAEKGKPLGKVLGEFITIVKPETLLKWHRRLVASEWDFSSRRAAKPEGPFVPTELEQWVLQFARENPAWGYDRIVGALASLGYRVSDQTVGNILKRYGLGPAPERKRNTTWAQFIRRHKEVLWATDFFTAEVWTATGLSITLRLPAPVTFCSTIHSQHRAPSHSAWVRITFLRVQTEKPSCLQRVETGRNHLPTQKFRLSRKCVHTRPFIHESTTRRCIKYTERPAG